MRVRKELRQERRVHLVSELQSGQPEGVSGFRDAQRKPDGEKVASSKGKAETKKCQGEEDVQTTAGNRKGCRDAEMTSANRIKRNWHHQAKMSTQQKYRGKNFKR